MTPEAQDLSDYMSYLSEDHWAAGWLNNWEYICWDGLHGEGERFTEAEKAKLVRLHDAAGGWIVWPETFLSTPEWLAHLAERQRQ